MQLWHYLDMKILEKKIGKKSAKLRVFLHHDFSSDGFSSLSFPKRRRAVLVIPGGGYNHVSEREAEPVAMAFFSRGYEAAVLYYSVGDDIALSSPVSEAAEAAAYIRTLESVDEERITAIGFSAGGHLAAMLAEHGNDYCKGSELNALILSYPVITMGEHAHVGSRDEITLKDICKYDYYSAEKNVSSSFPPTFIWSTRNDGSVDVQNSLMMYSALMKENIYSELHIYPDGVHGLSLATLETGIENPYVSSWIDDAFKFLDSVF